MAITITEAILRATLAVEGGRPVDCSRMHYLGGVRNAMLRHAESCHLRGRVTEAVHTNQEVRRLDDAYRQFAFLPEAKSDGR